MAYGVQGRAETEQRRAAGRFRVVEDDRLLERHQNRSVFDIAHDPFAHPARPG